MTLPEFIVLIARQVGAVQHHQRRDVLAFVAKLPVRIVFDDRYAVLIREHHQLFAPRTRKRYSAWVLEVRQNVHELWPRAQRVLHVAGLDAVSVNGNGDVLGAHQVERLQRAEVSRALHQDAVAAIDEQLGDQVQRLLRTRSDQHVIDAGQNSIARHVRDDVLAQRPIAFRRPVLQCRRSLASVRPAGMLPGSVPPEIPRGGQAAGKGDHFWTLCKLEKFADDRAFGGLGALCVTMCPGRCHTTPPLTN